MANYKKRQAVQRKKGCGLCDTDKRAGNKLSVYEQSRFPAKEADSRLRFRAAVNYNSFDDV